jgi:hypothetical protein
MQPSKDHMYAFGRPAGALHNGHSHVVAHITTSSPPVSPAHSPRLRKSRSMARAAMPSREAKPKYGSPGTGKAHHSRHSAAPPLLLQKLSQLFLSFFFRRHRLLLLIPFVYITGTLLYMGGDLSLPDAFPFPGRYRPGSVYRSDLVFEHLWPQMEKADAASNEVSNQPQ